MGQQTELKIYKQLAQSYKSAFNALIYKASNCVEYGKDPKDAKDLLEKFVNGDNYTRRGMVSKEDQAIIDLMEYLLDDTSQKPRSY